jgi:hypothetical protein
LDFFREILFLLQNVPALAHRYEKQSFFAGAFLLVSIASALAKNNLFPPPSALGAFLKWISAGALVLTGLAFVLAFIDLAKDRLPFDDLVCTDITDDAYYHKPEEQTYELVQRCRCTNRTNASIRNFAPLQDGYYQDVPAWNVQYALIGRPSVQLDVIKPFEHEVRKNNFPGGNGFFYIYRANTEFNPPLPPGEGIDLIYGLSASGAAVEAGAFSSSGTVFARGVEYDTLNYYVTIHAPPGFEVKLSSFGVLDPSGIVLADETQRQRKPEVSASGGLLQWRVSLARRHLRYMVGYRFEAYGWH